MDDIEEFYTEWKKAERKLFIERSGISSEEIDELREENDLLKEKIIQLEKQLNYKNTIERLTEFL